MTRTQWIEGYKKRVDNLRKMFSTGYIDHPELRKRMAYEIELYRKYCPKNS